MTPAEASKLRIGDRCWFQADMVIPYFPNGIYTVLATTETTVAGRKSVRVKISAAPEVWARPEHLSRVSRGQ